MQKKSRRDVCKRCSRLFYPDPYNAGRQLYCRDPDCRLGKKRERDRNRYKGNYDSKATFREREQKRCREGNRRRRMAAQKTVPDIAHVAISPPVPDMHNVVAGFVAQTIGSTDPVLVAKQLEFYGDWGRRLAMGPMICGPPDG